VGLREAKISHSGRVIQKLGTPGTVPVAEHILPCTKMGPHRDIVGDLAKAVRAQGLHFGVSSHRVEHDFFMGVGRKIPSDVNPYREHLIRFAEDQHSGLPPHAPTPCSR
jgi:alpha-L-fucosidase-like protein